MAFRNFILKFEPLIFWWLFTLSLEEVLTSLSLVTLVLYSLMTALSQLSIYISKWRLSFFAIIYGIIFYYLNRTHFDPEVAFNFLFGLNFIKQLEGEKKNDQFVSWMIQSFTIISGLLFNKGFLFFILIILFLLKDLFKLLKTESIFVKFNKKEFLKILLKIGPVIFILFAIFPRIPMGINPYPTQQLSTKEGQVGFSDVLDLSAIQKLEPSYQEVFFAEVKTPLAKEKLYWRGQSLSQNNGFIWRPILSELDSLSLNNTQSHLPVDSKNIVKIWPKKQLQYYFALEHPIEINIEKSSVILNDPITLKKKQSKINRAYSFSFMNESVDKNYTNSHLQKTLLTKRTKDWIRSLPDKIELLIPYLERYYRDNFLYTLNPGKTDGLDDFLFQSKKGFCGHFAASLAVILREKSVPSRIISGYLGGDYRTSGNFYVITDNDAHVWVEYWDMGKWKRLDPTLWVFAERISLNTNDWLATINNTRTNFIRRFYNDYFIHSIQQWDLAFMALMESWNDESTSNYTKKLRIEKSMLVLLFSLVIVLFILIQLLYFKFKSSATIYSLYYLKKAVKKKNEKYVLPLSLSSLEESDFLIDRKIAAQFYETFYKNSIPKFSNLVKLRWLLILRWWRIWR